MDLRPRRHVPRRLVITAHQLHYADPTNVRLLLAASDVTDARLADRLKDDLLREKAVLSRSCSTGSPTACRSSPAC